MEDVRTILMHVDSVNILTVYIATQMPALVNNKALFALLFKPVCHHRPIESGTNYKVIILIHILHLYYYLAKIVIIREITSILTIIFRKIIIYTYSII